MKLKTILITTAATLALSCNAHAKTLTIGIDLSGSNPLLAHENFAYGASQYISNKIMELKSGDIVQLKTFGARNDARNLINSRIIIGRKIKPQKVAQQVGQYIRALSGQTDIGQSSTNLLAWLEFTDGFECQNSSDILVITDALESSSYISGQDLIEGKKPLPTPDVSLKGCSLTFYGLGVGWSPQHVKTVRNAWRTWSDKAGASFKSIIP